MNSNDLMIAFTGGMAGAIVILFIARLINSISKETEKEMYDFKSYTLDIELGMTRKEVEQLKMEQEFLETLIKVKDEEIERLKEEGRNGHKRACEE